MDVASGAYWYEGPDFKKRHEIYPANATFKRKTADGSEQTVPGFEGALGVNNAYSDCFLTFAYDFNGDGWPDVLVYGFPGKEAAWYENPQNRPGHWQRHVILDVLDNESPGFMDITGDGKPEMLCCSKRLHRLRGGGLEQPGGALEVPPHLAQGRRSTRSSPTASARATSTATGALTSSRRMAGGSSRRRWQATRSGSSTRSISRRQPHRCWSMT